MALALRHNLPDVGLENVLNLIDCHLPSPVYKSKYRFLQSFPYPNYVEYFYCYECAMILDFENNQCVICKSCKKNYQKRSLIELGQYFLHIPLKDQLIELINSKVYVHFRKIENDVNDIIHGKVYTKLEENNVIGTNDISISWNSDGVRISKSSKRNMWPILVSINEFPYRIRRNNILLCGLWSDQKKPLMNVFLQPFANELVELSRGFESTTLIHKQPIFIKVHAPLSPVDSVARCAIQNMRQYNGRYGCSYCYHKGKHIPVKRGSARVYCGAIRKLRSGKQHRKLVKIAVEKKKVIKGVKGPCVMSLVPNFNVISSFPPDYLHACLLGVGKLFLTDWFDSSNCNEEWYLGNHSKVFNDRLLIIKPPCEITRTPQSSDDMSKGHEIKNFILYYSLPSLDGLMPQKYLKHWFLYVYSLHIYSKDKATDEELDLAKSAIYQFVEETEAFYGNTFMKYNIHLLLHVPHFVKLYGAVWAWSTFSFEHYNGVVRRLFHGTQYIPHQICKQYHRLRYIKNHSDVFAKEGCSQQAQWLFTKLMNQCRVKKCIEYESSLRLFGKPIRTKISIIEKVIIERLLGDSIEEDCQIFQRFVYNRVLFHSNNYKRLKKRNNSCILTTDGRLMSISKLVEVRFQVSEEMRYVILGDVFEISNEQLCKNGRYTSKIFSFVVDETSTIVCCEVSSIQTKCIKVPYKDKCSLFPVVNKVETD